MYIVYSMAYVESNPSEFAHTLELDDGSKIVLPNLVIVTEDVQEARKLLHINVDNLCDKIEKV